MHNNNIKEYKRYIKEIFNEWNNPQEISQETKEIAIKKVIKALQKEDKGLGHPGAQKVLKNYILKEVLS